MPSSFLCISICIGISSKQKQQQQQQQQQQTDLVDSDLAEVQSAMESALDQTTLSDTAASYGSGTSTAAMRAALWTRLETFMDSLLKVAIRMRHLERVLAKKKDPTTHIRFLDDVLPPPDAAEGGGSAVGGAAATTSTSLVMQFWHKLSVTMSATLGKLKDDASFIHQVHTYRCVCNTHARTRTHTHLCVYGT